MHQMWGLGVEQDDLPLVKELWLHIPWLSWSPFSPVFRMLNPEDVHYDDGSISLQATHDYRTCFQPANEMQMMRATTWRMNGCYQLWNCQIPMVSLRPLLVRVNKLHVSEVQAWIPRRKRKAPLADAAHSWQDALDYF